MKKYTLDLIGYLLFIWSSWSIAHLFIRLNIEGGESIIREPSALVRGIELVLAILVSFYSIFIVIRFINRLPGRQKSK